MIGSFPYLRSQFQYYDRKEKDYFYFVPTGFEPEYIQNLRDLKSIGQFGKTLEKVVVITSLAWSPIGRQIMMNFGGDYFYDAIDKHDLISTKQRATELLERTDASDYQKRNVITIAVADVEDKDGNTRRFVALNSAAARDPKISGSIEKQLKPNELMIGGILGDDAHAEENLNEFARRWGWRVKSLDASRNFCPSCSEARRRQGSTTETQTSRRFKPRMPNPNRIRR